MSGIRFDNFPAAAVSDSEIESIRDPLVANDLTAWQTTGCGLDPERLAPAGLFLLPRRYLEAYEAEREQSPLGRIFSVTNGMHDDIDAVVIVGREELLSAPRALIQTGTDRYHNEMNRAQRGSKPRYYFVNDQVDNDAVASLVHRIQSGGYGSTKPESQWAMIVLDDAAESPEITAIFDTLLTHLPGDSVRYVIPVVRSGGDLHRRVQSIGCQECFLVDDFPEEALNSRSRLFSAMTMLPLAMLAMDCIKWLESAMLLGEEFRDVVEEEGRLATYLKHFPTETIPRFQGTTWALDGVAQCLNELVRRRPGAASCDATHELRIELRLEAFRHDGLPWNDSTTWAAHYCGFTETDTAIAQIILPTLDTPSLAQLFQCVVVGTLMSTQLEKPLAPL